MRSSILGNWWAFLTLTAMDWHCLALSQSVTVVMMPSLVFESKSWNFSTCCLLELVDFATVIIGFGTIKSFFPSFLPHPKWYHCLFLLFIPSPSLGSFIYLWVSIVWKMKFFIIYSNLLFIAILFSVSLLAGLSYLPFLYLFAWMLTVVDCA